MLKTLQPSIMDIIVNNGGLRARGGFQALYDKFAASLGDGLKLNADFIATRGRGLVKVRARLSGLLHERPGCVFKRALYTSRCLSLGTALLLPAVLVFTSPNLEACSSHCRQLGCLMCRGSLAHVCVSWDIRLLM